MAVCDRSHEGFPSPFAGIPFERSSFSAKLLFIEWIQASGLEWSAWEVEGVDAPVTRRFWVVVVVALPRIILFGDSFTWHSLSREDWRGSLGLGCC